MGINTQKRPVRKKCSITNCNNNVQYLLQIDDGGDLFGFYCTDCWKKMETDIIFDVDYTVIDINKKIKDLDDEIDDLEGENFHIECDNESTDEEIDDNESEIWNLRRERDTWISMLWE